MIHYTDDTITLHHGDALDVLRTLPAGSVNCCVTSPPYFGLRDYGVEGQLGLEASPAEYVAAVASIMAEVKRVLADDGTAWLNLGDSFSVRWSSQRSNGSRGSRGRNDDRSRRTSNQDTPEKNLLGIPWRVAFALQDDGWILRNAVVWAKPNGMPESVTDRLATKYEHVFMLSKSRRYYFNLDAIRAPHSDASMDRFASGPVSLARRTPGETRNPNVYGAASSANLAPTGRRHNNVSRRDSFVRSTKEASVPGQSTAQHREDRPDVVAGSPLGKNPGDVWTIPTAPFAAAHFACMPIVLAERCVLAGCPPGGIVLDPFSGSGTTGLAATRNGRRYVGIDLNRDYLDLSLRTRLAQGALIEGVS